MLATGSNKPANPTAHCESNKTKINEKNPITKHNVLKTAKQIRKIYDSK